MQRAKWPEYLVVPDVEQFRHGQWIDFDYGGTIKDKRLNDVAVSIDNGRGWESKKDVEGLAYHCRTSCRVVGWACLAFGEKGCEPIKIENPATVEFLKKFIELAGAEPPERERHGWLEDFSFHALNVGLAASEVFEGSGNNGGLDIIYRDRVSLSAEEARSIWILAGDHFGYDMEHLLD